MYGRWYAVLMLYGWQILKQIIFMFIHVFFLLLNNWLLIFFKANRFFSPLILCSNVLIFFSNHVKSITSLSVCEKNIYIKSDSISAHQTVNRGISGFLSNHERFLTTEWIIATCTWLQQMVLPHNNKHPHSTPTLCLLFTKQSMLGLSLLNTFLTLL